MCTKQCHIIYHDCLYRILLQYKYHMDYHCNSPDTLNETLLVLLFIDMFCFKMEVGSSTTTLL